MERSYILVTNGLVEVLRPVVGAALKIKKGKNAWTKKNLPGMVVVGFSVIGARGTRC
jgi:hypothetical protein